jgi:hypothetical protein
MPARRAATPAIIPQHDELAAARATAIVLWRGEPIPFDRVPDRIASISGRAERDALYGSWIEALEALNPHYEARLQRWRTGGDLVDVAAQRGTNPRTLLGDLDPFVLHGETPYYAALRRNLALIDIEQGDATEADLWHVVRGSAWAHWFGARDVARSVAAFGGMDIGDAVREGWLAAEASLAGTEDGAGGFGARVVAETRRTLAGSPAWLRDELRVTSDEVPAFVDFAAFVRLWRLRRDIGRLRYELRLVASPDAAVARAYYTGILGHMTGVAVHEAGYLHAVPAPFASVTDIEAAVLAGSVVDVLESRWGDTWWRTPEHRMVLDEVGDASSTTDALARLGYDALDWRPVLRQIRTRLIGEMSGYGGPNITTRAGTRKV